METVINKTNVMSGAVVTLASYILGPYWFLFGIFLALNVIDYATGYIKAKFYNKNESSAVGAKGIVKKVMYWLIILMAFLISIAFKQIGSMFGMDLGFVVFLGYLTLATYIVNETRSIIENAYEMNMKVPEWLIKGLDIVESKIDIEAENKMEKK
ncbi:phage holin family protein [Velocimicrobium porci]|uniref:Phage holin family protein n=1 Tax=Velocimicrobium porci TaxID=2606634 RepID=A0A6L5Y0Y0_9FIRM|nr:phage holin family protein [Velocimicrobium porci]MSS64612.1 phage holin family protein [Velocimicrobium porci]